MRYLAITLIPLLIVSCSGDHDPSVTTNITPTDTQPAGYATTLGTVNFPVSCKQEAANLVERGVALLHHMTYVEAEKTFTEAIDNDPDCALAYWGRGMSYIHPLWGDTPSDEQMQQSLNFIDMARNRGEKTQREKDYIEVLAAYYEGWSETTEPERLGAFDRAWQKLYQTYPDDLEAAAFYALMHLAPPRFLPNDKAYPNQKESAAIVKSILEQIPDHPGAHHYVIHAYDFPELAEYALKESHNYGKIAPDVPHALHMPSHIFTRLGMWNESIAWNSRSAEVSLKQSNDLDAIILHYPHALDYLVYAHLQLSQHSSAETIRDKLMNLDKGFHPYNLEASAYAISAIPARIPLEKKDWAGAAKLKTRTPEIFPWQERFSAYESITYFAKAIGATRSNDLPAARESLEKLETLKTWIDSNRPNSYWAKQADIQVLSAGAWLAFVEGRHDDAMPLMQEAVALEAVTEKAAVTPGEVIPAGELFADMLMEMEQYDDALSNYAAVLKRSPNRFNSLYGAARAAEASDKHDTAGDYYQKVLDLSVDAEIDRNEIQMAMAYLEKPR